MAELKTKPNDLSVTDYINSIEDNQKRNDSLELLKIFKEVTGLNPKMWGSSIVGYGMYHYKSERSSQQGYWPLTAFSARKQSLTIYIMPGFKDYSIHLSKLGKCKTSVSCLYVKKLSDINIAVLKEIIKDSFLKMKKIHNVK